MQESVRQFFGCYFHQDWSVEYASYQAAVDDFSKFADAQQLKDVLEFVQELLAKEHSEVDMTAFGGSYSPPNAGVSNAEFLNYVQASILSRSSGKI